MISSEIEYLDTPKDGSYCKYSTEKLIPQYFRSYDAQARYSRKHKPEKYYTHRGNWHYDKALHFQGRSLNAVLMNLLRDKAEINFLDVGCGEGNGFFFPAILMDRINKFGITASDFRTPMQKLRHALHGVSLTFGNTETLTDYFPRNFFDVVVSMEAIPHMDQRIVIPQIVDITMPGGIIMLNRGNDIIASRTPRVMELESYANEVAFRKTPGL